MEERKREGARKTRRIKESKHEGKKDKNKQTKENKWLVSED
jgi:hypothetical protein